MFHDLQQRIADLYELVWLAITKASHAASVIPIPWVAVPAGATQTVAVQNSPQYFEVDASAAQVTLDFPASPIDGQEVTITISSSATAADVLLVAGAGTKMADPGTPGTFSSSGGTVGLGGQGSTFKIKFQAATSKWIQAS